jgi:predicted GIY-YIG superfamily endonuclease
LFVSATQTLLFLDPRPLVERLGREFFRQLPERPGVYLMRDAGDVVLYVGKAKNLRKRLGSYRVANPERMPRRHLRLLRAVERIELQECPDEISALAKESELLRALKPKFNRAGTWPGKPHFLNWRCTSTTIEFLITEKPEADARVFGPSGSGLIYLRAALVRLIWFAVHPEMGFTRMPAGWVRGHLENPTTLPCGSETSQIMVAVEDLFSGRIDAFCDWVKEKISPDIHPFEKGAIEAEIEFISDFFTTPAGSTKFQEPPVETDAASMNSRLKFGI